LSVAAVLRENCYGKSGVRLTKVIRLADRHDLIELSADIALRGDFAASYTDGDNSNIVATDSIKNTVYVLAKETQFNSVEEFAITLARHFVATYPQVLLAQIELEQTLWQRIIVGAAAHRHAFVAGGGDRRTCRATLERAGERLALIGGIAALEVIKTTGSEFSGFVTDRFRTLKDTNDRIMATRIEAEWTYASEVRAYNECFDTIRAVLLETFADHHSLAVQQTLLKMGEAALAACAAIKSIRLEMPNQHRIPFNLEPFGVKSENDIFVPTDAPFGMISGSVERQ
jgi:urate oxidase